MSHGIVLHARNKYGQIHCDFGPAMIDREEDGSSRIVFYINGTPIIELELDDNGKINKDALIADEGGFCSESKTFKQYCDDDDFYYKDVYGSQLWQQLIDGLTDSEREDLHEYWFEKTNLWMRLDEVIWMDREEAIAIGKRNGWTKERFLDLADSDVFDFFCAAR